MKSQIVPAVVLATSLGLVGCEEGAPPPGPSQPNQPSQQEQLQPMEQEPFQSRQPDPLEPGEDR